MVQPDGSTSAQPDGYRLGVLFVHGIGEQQQYSTLARFGGALQRWLRQWEDGRQHDQPKRDRVARPAAVDVLAVDAHPGDRKDPAHAEMAVGSGRKWLLAEAWWAPEVTPPRFKDFITWVLPMFPWLAAEYAVAAGHRIYRPDPSPSLHGRDPTWVERWSLAGLVWLASPLIAVVLMVVCLLLALLQRLPVVGKRVSSLTVSLVKGVGDTYLFAHDALARTAMVQRIRHDLDWLRAKGCERVVIVAHSQGAALCHDMLRDDNRPKEVDLLVTVGSGVQRLNEFRQLYRDAALRSIGWRSIGAMVALAAGMVLVVGALGPGVPGPWTWSGVALVVAGALFPGMYNARGAASKGGPTPDNEAELTRGGVVWGTALGCAGTVALAVGGLVAGGPAGTRLLGGAALLGLGIFGYAVAYRMVEARLETPPQLALPRDAFNLSDDREEQRRWVHWVDYYSSADPVPNGPLVTWRGDEPPAHLDPGDPAAVHPWPRLVYNLRSVQADHSFYFDNADEFLPQLALDLAGKAGQSLDPLHGRADLLRARAARRWRTSCRSDLRNLLLGGGLLGALAVSLRLGGGGGWARLGADLGVRSQSDYGLVGQLSRSVLTWLAKLPFLAGLDTLDLQVFSGLLVAAVAVAGGAIALGWLWSMWDRHGIARFFQQHQAERVGSGALEVALRRAPAVAFLTLAALLLAGTAAAAQRYAGAWWLWLALLLAGGFTACLTVLRWRTCLGRARTRPRPPDAPAPPSRPDRSDSAPSSPTRPRSAHPEEAKA